MNIIVCIKQVPETTEVKIDPETNALIREGVASIVNPFDENAIETALQLRDKHGGKVTVITMGPPQAESALRQALAMGADEAILLTDPKFRGSDTLATSYALAQTIRKIGDYDLIICGKQAIDGDTAQVPPGVAERLGLPQVTFVINVEVEGKTLRCKRMLEDCFEVVQTRLPAVISVVKQINEPRHPPMKGVLRARRAQIPHWTAADIGAEDELCGFDGSPTFVERVFTPPKRQAQGEVFQGETEEVVEALFQRLKQLDLA